MFDNQLNKDKIFLKFRVVPGISNLGVLLVIIGFLSLTFTMVAKDFTFLFYGLGLIFLGAALSFAPKYLLFDYKNKTIRNYFSWGIIKVGKTISIDDYDEIEVLKFDRTYRNQTLYHENASRNITYEVYLKSTKKRNSLMLCGFSDRESAMNFAVKHGNKLHLKINDKVVEANRKKIKHIRQQARR